MVFCAGFCVPRRRRNQILTSYPVTYKKKNRDACLLLSACWNQDWDQVRRRCQTHPREAFCKTLDSGRTALHLACMPGTQAPEDVIELLIDCNPHALIVQDNHQYSGTPMHFLCGSVHRDNPRLMGKAVQAALTVTKKCPFDLPVAHYWSPFSMACYKCAPAGTLEVIIQGAGTWIAPYTGCETQVYGGKAYPTPLRAIWDGVKEHLQSLDEQTIQSLRTMTTTADPLRENDAAIEAWRKLSVLLRWGAAHNKCRSIPELMVWIHQPVPGLMRLVCAVFPESMRKRTKDGITILQALLYRSDIRSLDPTVTAEMLFTIVELCPELLMVREKWCDFCPVMRAASLDLSLDIVYAMLVAAPQVMLYTKCIN